MDLKLTDFGPLSMEWACSLIWELMLYEFELGHNITKISKNICCVKKKGWGTVDHSNQMIQEILCGLQEPSQSGKGKKA